MGAGASGLALAGVEAIVERLSSFQGDVKKMNSALDSIKPRSTLLQRAFSGAWDVIKGFGREILNVAEYALGHLLSSAIQWAVGRIRALIAAFVDLVKSTIEAGSELQLLQLRLNRLNFNELKKTQEDIYNLTQKDIRALTKQEGEYVSMGQAATEATKEQLNWLIKLAATTPYDNADIANVYTLARSYGFAAEESKGLTQNIVDFASGMGLTEEHIKRIIINFGQMKQQGKITGMELRDLARGAFVPVNDILSRVADNLGITQEQLDKLRKKGLTDAEMFFAAFSGMVEDDFIGAAADMRRALVPAIENIKEIFRSLLSWNVVLPIMDLLGGKLSDITDEIVGNEKMWNRLTGATERIGKAVTGMLEGLFNLLPDSGTIAEVLISGLEKFAGWIEDHQDDVFNFFKRVSEVMGLLKEFGFTKEFIDSAKFGKTTTQILEFINNIRKGFRRFTIWLQTNGPLIQDFFNALGEIVSTVFGNLAKGKGGGKIDILDSITKFMMFVVANKDEIAKWVEILIKAFLIWQAISTIWSIVVGALIGVITTVLAFTGMLIAMTTAIGAVASVLAIPLVAAIAIVGAAFLLLISILALLYAAWKTNFLGLAPLIETAFETVKLILIAFGAWLSGDTEKAKELLRAAWEGILTMLAGYASRWLQAGMDAVGKMTEGFRSKTGTLIVAATLGVYKTIDAIKGTLKSWIKAGKDMMAGLAEGIKQGAAGVVAAIVSAVKGAIEAAKEVLVEQSPSKVFEKIGAFTMEGFAEGVDKYAGKAYESVARAMSGATVPAMATTNNYSTTNHMNLNINSSARREPIIQDFNMLQSMVG